MGQFVITKRISGEFLFSLTTGNGETVLIGEGFSTKTNCHQIIETIKRHAPDDDKYDLKIASNGKYYFTLEAVNGQTIGVSPLFESEAGRKNGIQFVKTCAPSAIVQDSTI